MLYIIVVISPQVICIVMSDFKETCIWMSYRYAIGRKSIASVMHAADIARHMDWVPTDRWEFTGRDILREVNDRIGWYKNVHFVSYGDHNYDVFGIVFQWFEDNPTEDMVKYFVEHEWYIDLVYGVVTDIQYRKEIPEPTEDGSYLFDNLFKDYSDYKDWVRLANLFLKKTKTVSVDFLGSKYDEVCQEWWECQVWTSEVTLCKRYSSGNGIDNWCIDNNFIKEVK